MLLRFLLVFRNSFTLLFRIFVKSSLKIPMPFSLIVQEVQFKNVNHLHQPLSDLLCFLFEEQKQILQQDLQLFQWSSFEYPLLKSKSLNVCPSLLILLGHLVKLMQETNLNLNHFVSFLSQWSIHIIWSSSILIALQG